MPEDFFAEGFGQEQGPIFTKEQNQFLQKNLKFLDPMKTYQISIGKVLSLLKYTNLDNQTIKKIINNSCASGIGQKIVTYEEMKKIFRGVALKQNKIEPSKINIEANIKTNLPILYDDDDDSQQEQKKPPPKTQQKQPQPQKITSNPAQIQNLSANQPPQPSRPQQQVPLNPLKAFDDYWKTLKTKNNLIDGSQVKKLFTGNNTNKNNLSKAWKLCNISQKGVLTKGQFFIFMNLIHNPNIPDALTKEMKDLIKQIEEACGYKKAVTTLAGQTTGQRSSSTSNPVQKRPSDAFDKFGDESLFVKNNSKVEDLPKSDIIPKSASNVFSAPSSTLASSSILSPPTTHNITAKNKNALQLLQRVQHVGKHEKSRERQISTISKSNEQMIEGLGSIEQYLNMVEQNFQATTAKIQILKQTQNSLNERLNNVCLKFKNIITKQSDCITYLMDTIKVDSQANTQRLQILEGYTEQMLQMVDSNMEASRNQVAHLQKQQTHAIEGLKYQNEQLRQKISTVNNGNHTPRNIQKLVENNDFRNSPEFGPHSRVDPFEDNEVQEHHSEQAHQYGYKDHGASSKSIINDQPTNHFSAGNNKNQRGGQTFLENLSPEERKKTKQMLLIQILNSVSSMNEKEYQEVVAKVVAMTQEQMNQSYTKLYALYMQNVAKSGTTPRYPVPSPEQFTAPYS